MFFCMGKGHRHLPRLGSCAYRGFAAIHWIHTIRDRDSGWLGTQFHGIFRELLLHAAARYGLFCPVYCLMPDHLHLLWMGCDPASNQKNASQFLRRHVNATLGAVRRGIRLQHQPYDHVLREDERRPGALEVVAQYIAMNPVRAGLVAEIDAREYPYAGSLVVGYPDLCIRGEAFWPRFWKIYRGRLDAAEPTP